MLRSEAQIKEVPLKIVGGNVFGRYSKISVESTWNMIVSDEALVDFSGYSNVLALQNGSQGRGLYTSTIAGTMFAVAGNSLYAINNGISKTFLGTLGTSVGNVWITENNNSQILISDNVNLYVWNYSTNVFVSTVVGSTGAFSIDFVPGYISFQNGRFICAVGTSESWRLSDFNNGLSWPNDTQHVGAFQTKPNYIQCVVRFPSRGNLLLVMGQTVAEFWTDSNTPLFPYIKSSTQNIDYGCLNPATVVGNEDIIIWLAGNEQSGPAIMYTTGGDFKKISNDGIDFKLSQLTTPTDSYGSLFRQDGHLIYILTFPTDNLSYIFDFNTNMFFTVSDENLNYFIARKVVYFNDKYYFISFKDGNLYEFGTQFTNYQYSPTEIYEIPRIRICPPLRLPNQRWFIGRSVGFTMEQGQPNIITTYLNDVPGNEILLTTEDGTFITTESGIDIRLEQYTQVLPIEVSNMRVDLSISRDGGETFGNIYGQNMNATGVRKNRFIYYRLGQVNDCTFQFRWWGFSRFVCLDGLVEIYQ